MIRKWEATEGGKLLKALNEGGMIFFCLNDAMRLSCKNYSATALMLNRLEKAGWLVRLNRGRYTLADINYSLSGDGGQSLDKLVVGRELVGGHYYIGYGSALEAHGLVGVHGLPDFVTVVLKETTDGTDKKQMDEPKGNFEKTGGCQTVRRLPRRRVLGVEYRFVRDPQGSRKIVNPKAKPAQWMVMEMEVRANERVWVSDPEWTILTGLGRPELCGGIGVISAALDGWRERLDLEKLVRYTHYMRNMTAARRLGYLLEQLGMHTERTRLRLGLQVRTSYGRLEPGKPWKGDLERKWRVDVNVESLEPLRKKNETTDGTHRPRKGR